MIDKKEQKRRQYFSISFVIKGERTLERVILDMKGSGIRRKKNRVLHARI